MMLNCGMHTYYSRRHDRGVFDASFIKLREVSIGYDFPKAWFQNSFIGGLRLSAYGRNLALLKSNVPHIDPETAFDSTNAMQGIEFGQLPSARTNGYYYQRTVLTQHLTYIKQSLL